MGYRTWAPASLAARVTLKSDRTFALRVVLPLIIFTQNHLFPLTVGMGLWSQHATTSGDANLYPLIVMGGLVTIVPLIALFLVLQRYWRGGLLLGSIAN